MSHSVPYYALDTDGVHFEVDVDESIVQAYISRDVLSATVGRNMSAQDCVGAYLRYRERIDAAVIRRVRAEGPETVLVRESEIRRSVE